MYVTALRETTPGRHLQVIKDVSVCYSLGLCAFCASLQTYACKGSRLVSACMISAVVGLDVMNDFSL